MTEFNNVTIIKKANVYFNGNVVSRIVRFADGTEKTLGFMQPGEYRFNTGVPEVMEIISGELKVQLPGSDDWISIVDGEIFNVPGSSEFTMEVLTPTDYCCSYIK